MTGTVQIRIYDDRLEVWNPGMLPTGMSVEELYREHPSRPRNPRLASAMHRARLIEHWGTGTLRIINACESRGMPKPEFVSSMGSFIVRFNSSLNEPTPETNNESSGWQQIALNYIRENGSITTSVFQKLLGVSNRQAYRYLMHMVDEGIIIRQGSGRAIQYLHVNLDME